MGVSNEERFKNADGMIEDDYRIDFVQEHLEWCIKVSKKALIALDIICGHQSIVGLG